VDAFRAWLEVLALAASPLIAVQVSAWLQRDREKRNRKVWVLSTLLATRHSTFADDRLRAINLVEFYFHDDANVRHVFREYMTMLGNEGLNNPQGFAERDRKLYELINEMARSLGFEKTISALDYQRSYVPKFLVQVAEQNKKTQALIEQGIAFFTKAQAAFGQGGSQSPDSGAASHSEAIPKMTDQGP